MRARNRWGWGFEDAAISTADARAAAPGLVGLLGFGETRARGARRRSTPSALPAAAPRAARRTSTGICTADAASPRRATPAASPTSTPSAACAAATSTSPTSSPARATTREIEDVLEWAGGGERRRHPVRRRDERRRRRRAARARPLRRRGHDRPRGASTRCARSTRSRARRASAPGASGPRIEEQLAAHGLTLRFFPQSFELSTLGGWIATRAGGHFATHLTHIDDLVESVRAVGPAGHWVSRRLPGSGAGPSPDRLLLGSEGILGLITEAWVRVRPRPVHRARARGAVRVVPRRRGGRPRARAVRARAGATAGSSTRSRRRSPAPATARDALLTLGFESADHPVDAVARARARDLPRARRRLGRERRRRGAGRRDRLVARGVPPHAVPPRPARAPRRLHRHVRVGGDVGALPGVPRVGDGGGRGGARRAVPRHVPPDARLSRRPGAVLHRPRPGAARRRGRAVARDEGRGRPGDPRRGRHDHAPPRRRSRPPAVVRRAAPGRVRRGPARGQGARSTRRACSIPAC